MGSDGTLTTPLDSPPLNVMVKSSAGGSDTEPVRLVGADFDSVVVAAAASANPTTAIPGQPVLLDSVGSSGDIASFQWTQLTGTPVTLAGANTEVATFNAPTAGGALSFRLTVTGAGGLTTSTKDVTVNVATGQAPVAQAGADRTAIVGTNVTLDGTASQYATGLPVGPDRRSDTGPQRCGNVDRIVRDARHHHPVDVRAQGHRRKLGRHRHA